jgi:hypothetical protein
LTICRIYGGWKKGTGDGYQPEKWTFKGTDFSQISTELSIAIELYQVKEKRIHGMARSEEAECA